MNTSKDTQRIFGQVFLVALLCGLTFGCGPKMDLPSQSDKSFESAQPEVRQLWDAAVAAADKNDFVGATTNLVALRSRSASFSAEQTKAVENFWGVFSVKVMAAAEKGNAAAVEAVKLSQDVRRR